MKNLQLTKKLGVILAFGFLCFGFSQVHGQSLPFNENTKQVWIQTHSTQYQQMLGINNGGGIVVPTEMTEAEKRTALNLPDVDARPPRMVSAPIVENPTFYPDAHLKVHMSQTELEALPVGKREAVLQDSKFVIYRD